MHPKYKSTNTNTKVEAYEAYEALFQKVYITATFQNASLISR